MDIVINKLHIAGGFFNGVYLNKMKRKKHIKKNIIFLILFIFFIGITGIILYKKIIPSSEKVCKNCNVIIIVLDTLRADRLPCYGYEKNTMKHLCAFAQDSVLFENHFVTETHTAPSHLSLFTSLYPSQHKVNIQGIDYVQKQVATLAQILKADGYKTIWTNGLISPETPSEYWITKGFDWIYSLADDKANWTHALNTIKIEEKTLALFHTWTVHDYYEDPAYEELKKNSSGTTPLHLITDKSQAKKKYAQLIIENNNALLPLVETNRRSFYEEVLKNSDSSLQQVEQFLEYAFNNRFTVKGAKLYAELRRLKRKALYGYGIGQLEALYHADPPLAAEYENLFSDLYDAKLIEADWQFQWLLDKLKQKGLYENSIIVVFSDHGETLYNRGEGVTHDQNPYNELIHTPLIIHTPQGITKKVAIPVSSIDIMPTLLDVLSLPPQHQAEGLSLVSLMKGEDSSPFINRPIISQHLTDHDRWVFNEATIFDDMKLITYPLQTSAANKLYRLSADPSEQINLAESEPGAVSDLKNITERYKETWVLYPSPLKKQDWTLDEATRKTLIETGYF